MRCSIMLLFIVTSAQAAEPVSYNRDVRPILSDNCFFCHGPDASKRKAKLRLDDREAAIEKDAFVPGKPDDSELIARILADDESKMPPEESHKTLTAKQKEILKTWIEQGAKYEPHWAFAPVVRPAGKTIDEFIRAELAKKKLSLSPEADRRTLIRRLYLDVLGLPPRIEDVNAFVNDARPDAYEQLVEAVLESEAYGERMAVMWLDQVRFADTVGYHGDQNQRIFPYRDYVINAFNNNKPFDAFTREQLAGDLLPKPTTEQLVATGFNRLNMMTREGGAQPKEYIAKYQGDRVRTVSLAWLGATMGCAECHDHKFDPFTAKDFYSMGAFFADVRQWGVYSDYTYTPNPDLKGWSNDHPFPPEIEVENAYLKKAYMTGIQQMGQLGRETVARMEKSKQLREVAFPEWVKDGRRVSSVWVPTDPKPVTGVMFEKDHTLLWTGKAAKGASTALTITPSAGWIGSVQLEALPNAKHGGRLSRDAAGVTIGVSVAVKGTDGKSRPVALLMGRTEHHDPVKWRSTAPMTDIVNGWHIAAANARKPRKAEYIFEKPFRLKDGEELVITVKSDNLGAARLAWSPFALCSTDVRSDLDKLDLENMNWISDVGFMFLMGTGFDAELLAQGQELLKRDELVYSGKAWTQVTVAQSPITTRVLPRGNFLDETGPVVLPATPGFLGGPASTPDKRLSRLDLADWLTSKQNPLTARVFVNRLWKMYFGTGLSAGVEDVGAQGEWPSHPELLDFLASEFQDKWDVKKMVKMIVLSQAYRQTSKARADVKEIDPSNRLLSYLPPRRLEAEFVRDNALAISGLLNRDLGGPSAKPYQPAGYYANIQFPNRDYAADVGRLQYRRGLYVHWQRTFLHPMLANFDAPSREECTAQRTNANTPQQALTLLNDPTFVEAARMLTVKVLQSAKDDDARIGNLFERALARQPKAAELQALTAFLKAQRAHYAAVPEEAAKLLKVGQAPMLFDAPGEEMAAWVNVCRVVLNLHECITRY